MVRHSIRCNLGGGVTTTILLIQLLTTLFMPKPIHSTRLPRVPHSTRLPRVPFQQYISGAPEPEILPTINDTDQPSTSNGGANHFRIQLPVPFSSNEDALVFSNTSNEDALVFLIDVHDRVVTAQLRLRLDCRRVTSSNELFVVDVTNVTSIIHEQYIPQTCRGASEGVMDITLDVSPLVLSHIFDGNYKIKLQIKTSHKTFLRPKYCALILALRRDSGDVISFVNGGDQGHVRPKRSSRSAKAHRRRHGGRHYSGPVRQNLCRRHPLYVDFNELDWQDWIIGPHGFQAYYCAGACQYPLTNAQNSTNHAIVQGLVNSVNPNAAPEPCCVPTSMSPISLLYMDMNNQIVLKNYPDMIVQGCGCR